MNVKFDIIPILDITENSTEKKVLETWKKKEIERCLQRTKRKVFVTSYEFMELTWLPSTKFKKIKNPWGFIC